MKKTILVALLICILTNANAQKAKMSTVETKTFVISDTNANELPEGVSYKNNKLTISKSIPFIKSSDGRSIIYKPNNGTYKFSCECAQGSSGSCNWEVVDSPDVLECSGSCTCVKTVTVTTPPIIKTKNLKIN